MICFCERVCSGGSSADEPGSSDSKQATAGLLSIVEPLVDSSWDKSLLWSLLSCHMRSPFVSTAHRQTHGHTHRHRDSHRYWWSSRPQGQRKETQQRKCKVLMWDCWVTLQRKWIRLRGQAGLYCLKEWICLCEWVSSPSAVSCLCGRPQDQPVGTNRRMCRGNLNSFVRQRNLIHEFFDLK